MKTSDSIIEGYRLPGDITASAEDRCLGCGAPGIETALCVTCADIDAECGPCGELATQGEASRVSAAPAPAPSPPLSRNDLLRALIESWHDACRAANDASLDYWPLLNEVHRGIGLKIREELLIRNDAGRGVSIGRLTYHPGDDARPVILSSVDPIDND